MKHRPAVHIGTSGWSYPHWRGVFYPEGLAASEWFAYYAERFASVEINNTFYRLPGEGTVRAWCAAAPPGFSFSVKASRYITHVKRLKEPEKTLAPLFGRMRLLGDKLGCFLLQLPPRWRRNLERLERFLEALDGRYRYAMEFRDGDWFHDRVYELLQRHRVAFCIYELDGRESPRVVTANHVYVRLHGPDGPYQGCYDRHTLEGWARAIRRWRLEGRDVFFYFDNDEAGHAARNALELRAMSLD